MRFRVSGFHQISWRADQKVRAALFTWRLEPAPGTPAVTALYIVRDAVRGFRVTPCADCDPVEARIMPFTAVGFDIDGTLYPDAARDSVADITFSDYRVLRALVERNGRPPGR
ncbi:MAG: hypothetical protein ACOC2D_13010 [Spirochaetota bacterium]